MANTGADTAILKDHPVMLHAVLLLVCVGGALSAGSRASCHLPKVVGPCEALILRYFYNTSTGLCENFYYGGCRANANNFQTLADCVALCQAV
ncbi:PI-actitoxin-Afv2b-like [Haliotis rufescens]|uniref:PI-actitoxin-Afv2b-like n=1 Tax=Haliotis rufescens TaxID=6454 RepID=UPI00201F8062|nr:PI-actitoxin-Afv2b-like [Haliotis rufescens]